MATMRQSSVTLTLTVCVVALVSFGCGKAGDDRESRAALRLYEGAPPVVPHAVEQWGRYDCLQCHRDGSAAGNGRTAPIAPHPEQTNCRQCHVVQTVTSTFRQNTFVALRLPDLLPPRANPIGPPHIPHRLQDRHDCVSCHLPKDSLIDANYQAPVPKHGMRTNCTQCHVPQDFRADTFPSRAAAVRSAQ